MSSPDALLLMSGHCAQCPAVLRALGELVKLGLVGRLEVVNVESHPQVASDLGVRSVPWVRIGHFELTGLRSQEELASWARRAAGQEGMADYLHLLLKEGHLQQVLRILQESPGLLAELLPIVANPEASLNVRLGAGAVFETYAGHPSLAALVEDLANLSASPDPRVRADATHYLGLSGAQAARPHLQARLEDSNRDVAEIAQDGLLLLASALPDQEAVGPLSS